MSFKLASPFLTNRLHRPVLFLINSNSQFNEKNYDCKKVEPLCGIHQHKEKKDEHVIKL